MGGDVELYARPLDVNRLSLSHLELLQSRFKIENAPPWCAGNQGVKWDFLKKIINFFKVQVIIFCIMEFYMGGQRVGATDGLNFNYYI